MDVLSNLSRDHCLFKLIYKNDDLLKSSIKSHVYLIILYKYLIHDKYTENNLKSPEVFRSINKSRFKMYSLDLCRLNINMYL